MKYSAITEKELEILEDAIINFGVVVTFSQLQELFKNDIQYTRKRISRLVKLGWLIRIKKGLYAISDISSRGSLSVASQAIVNLLVDNAYISFQSALQYHGLYDQLLSAISIMSIGRYRSRKIGNYTYRFIATQEKYFYGWDEYEIDGFKTKIASVEKALIDMIQFHRSIYSMDIVLEKLSGFQDDIDQNKLVDYLIKSNLTTKRIFGFLFDCAGWESQRLHDLVKGEDGVSYSSNSNNQVYCHKWNLYNDQYFEKYLKNETKSTAT